MAKRVSESDERRRKAEHGGTGTLHIAFALRVRNDPRDQCGPGGLIFLALVGPAVRLLGDSAPRWPVGSPAQWQRPRMWICA